MHGEWAQFYHEKNKIRNKFFISGYTMRFVNGVINNFERKEHDPMIPYYLFNGFESKSIVLIDIPFCNENEKTSSISFNITIMFFNRKFWCEHL